MTPDSPLPLAMAPTALPPGRAWHARVAACFGLALALALTAQILGGCQGCGRKKLRRFGATCGRDSECAGGVCFQGRCTTSCKGDEDCGGGVCIENICHEPDTDLDGDGLSNAFEISLQLDPANPDTDGDGSLDGVEVGSDLSHPRDTNGDGVIDAAQSNIGDADGDCMVDAIDVAPYDKGKANLPAAAALCNRGVCALAIGSVKVVCRKSAPLQEGVVLGCAGCGCKADLAVLPDWEASESLCDGLDNDCDGLVDEQQTWLDLPLGATCQHAEGLCAAYDAEGKAIKGEVECTSDKKAGCSIGPGGSQSLAHEETCNYQDDDCDGQTDEGYLHKGAGVGSPCDGCGQPQYACPDGAPANPPHVACTLEGDGAVCNGLPFESGFKQLSVGLPAPRARWTAVWSPAWRKLLLYGGQEPTATGTVVHDELWTLDTSAGAAPWTVAAAQAPGRRHKAALIWDEGAQRALLIGGSVDGEPALTVWSLDAAGKWEAVSALGTPDDVRVPPLPFALGGKWLRGAILTAGKARQLVLWVEGLKTLWRARLGVAGADWEPLKTDGAVTPGFEPLSGNARCVAGPLPLGSWAIALTSSTGTNKPGAYRLALTPTGAMELARLQGAVPEGLREGCVVDAQAVLHVFGGDGPDQPTTPTWYTATFAGLPAEASALVWTEKIASGDAAVALRRSDPTVAWDAKSARVVIAGGHARTGGPGTWHRRGLLSVLSWAPSTGAVSPLSRAAPQARIGQASGFSPTYGFCIGGGLVLDVPDVDGEAARVRPAADAWCANDNGLWTLKAGDLPPYAFGIGGLDPHGERLVMAAGYDIAPGAEVQEVWRLWQTGLAFDENNPTAAQPKVSDELRVLDLKTGALSVGPTPAPRLAASAVTQDPMRRRLIAFGGFNNTRPTRQLWLLDLPTLKFTQRGDDNGPMKAQYGSLLIFDAPSDTLAIAGGTHHNVNPTGKDPISLQIMDAPSTTYLGACFGQADAPLWMTRLDGPHQFVLRKLPRWGDPKAEEPVQKLFRTHFGQPSFLPILFDPIGRRGWVALPDVMPSMPADDKGTTCEGPKTPPWTDASVQLHVTLGVCGGQPRFYLEPASIQPAPSSAFMASAVYDHVGRRAWLWGGLGKDGRSSGALWRLDQSCKDGTP